MNPIRFLKNLFVDFLIKTTGTYIGSPKDKPFQYKEETNEQGS